MPTFKFQARDESGKLILGERFSHSASNLSAQLINEGMTPIQIKAQKDVSSIVSDIRNLFKSRKITNNDLTLLTRQMYTLTKAGVPIISAIKHLSTNSHNLRLSVILKKIAERLESGQNLAAAMENFPEVFTPLIIGMVKVGQSSGRLEDVFLKLTEYLELEGETVKHVKTAMRYPIFVFITIVIAILIINIFVIPTFARVYSNAGISLPLMTRMMIAMSTFFIDYWLLMTSIVLVIGFWCYRYFRTSEGKYLLHKYLLKMPIVGGLLKRILLQRMTQTFAIIVNAGIPILEGLTYVANSINNQYAYHEIILMQEMIQRGSSIVQAAYSCKLFGSLEIQMLAISEETGELGMMLEEISRYYQREVEYDLKKLVDAIEPILLAIVAAMVLMLALAVYTPIWSLVKLVHKA